MINSSRILPFSALYAVLMLGHAAVNAQGTVVPGPDVEEEEVTRYAVEIILFTYAESVSTGTEVFLPDLPEGYGDEPAYGDVPYYGDTPESQAGRRETFRRDLERTPGSDFAGDSENSFAVDSAGDSEDVVGDDSEGDLRSDSDGDAVSDLESNVETELEEIVVGGASVDFELLPTDALSMSSIHSNLERLDAYQPILWSGWTQIVREESVSPALQLRRLGNVSLNIDGSLTLYVGRFVHLVVDVALDSQQQQTLDYGDQSRYDEGPIADDRPTYDEGPVADDRPNYSEGPIYDDRPGYGDEPSTDFGRYNDPYGRRVTLPVVYRIQEDSIMRNGETRYFDHPKFGLIARLTLVEDDPAEELDSDNEGLLPDLLPGSAQTLPDAPEPETR